MANEDQAKGSAKKTGGKIKEKAGKALGDKEMEGEGKADQAEGSLQKAKGKIKDKI